MMAGAAAQFPFGHVLDTLEYGPSVEGEAVVKVVFFFSKQKNCNVTCFMGVFFSDNKG